MPIENEFNPFEEVQTFRMPTPVERVAVDGNVWTTTSSISIAQQREQTLAEIREYERMMVTRYAMPMDERIKKPKQKPIAKLLDEVSTHNKEVFDCVNKVQEEINTLEKTRLVELAEKYDNLLFLVIGKNYTLKGVSEKNKLGYYNTLTQQLINTIQGVTNGNDLTLEDFKQVMLRHVSRFVLLDDINLAKYNILFEELYKYYNTIKDKKKEKKSLMGREYKKETVCEDYINGTTRNPISETVRFTGGGGFNVTIH